MAKVIKERKITNRRPGKERLKIIEQEALALAQEVKRTGKHPEAVIVERGLKTVTVRCPYCGMLHAHGKAGSGGRLPHCYIINPCRLPEYEIVESKGEIENDK